MTNVGSNGSPYGYPIEEPAGSHHRHVCCFDTRPKSLKPKVTLRGVASGY